MPNGKLAEIEIKSDTVLRSYFSVRFALGGLGVLLPIVLFIHGFWSPDPFPTSISHFYHTNVGDFLVGCLCAIGTFLIAYQDPQPGDNTSLLPTSWDWWAATIAGLGAIGVAFAPVDPVVADVCRTALEGNPTPCLPTGLTGHGELAGFRNGYHFLFAGFFFLFIMLMCFTVLPFSNIRAKGRHASSSRTAAYFLYGLAILVSAVMLVFDNGASIQIAGKTLTSFFLLEVAAVLAFAAAWLTRSYEFMPKTS